LPHIFIKLRRNNRGVYKGKVLTINKLLVQELRSSFNNGVCYNQSSRGTRKARYLPHP
jgi:hypothetical protein